MDSFTLLIIAAIAVPLLALFGHLVAAYWVAPRRVQAWLASAKGRAQLIDQLAPAIIDYIDSPEMAPVLTRLTQKALANVGPALQAWLDDPETLPQLERWIEAGTKKAYDYAAILLAAEKGNASQGKKTTGLYGQITGQAGNLLAGGLPAVKTGNPLLDFFVQMAVPYVLKSMSPAGAPPVPAQAADAEFERV
jgi:hypothetical protein